MQGSSSTILRTIVLVFFCAAFLAMWLSPFVLSLCTVLLLSAFFLDSLEAIKPYRKLAFLFGGLILGNIISLVFVPQPGIAKELMLLVGWCLLSLAALVSRRIDWHTIFIVSTAIVLVVNLLSVGNYFAHKSMYDALLLQSKSIPVLGMHHIHFGIINAMVLLIGFGLYQENKRFSLPNWLWIGALSIIFVSFHILSSRTGLLGFYLTSIFGLVWYAIVNKQYKQLFIGLSGLTTVLILAFFLSSSFKNKVYNSLEDLKSLTTGVDKNYKSMTMRVEAYKTSMDIIKDYPLFGVGATAVNKTLQLYYQKNATELKKENRIGPHNQFLEYGIKYGLPGILWLLIFFLLMFVYAPKESIFPVLVVLLVFLSSQLESLFERQNSIFFISMYIGMSFNLFNRKNSEA
jgi:O-antigen ligase